MCGIAGRITDGAPVEEVLVRRMCDTLRHRGPDSDGYHVAGPAGLGMRRLAIIDVAGGDQPFHSEDGEITVVGNGEIYNHEELRRDLLARGHRFASHSDIEVVVHLWEELGPRCVERLHGMFALALWDAREGELFLARDRIGKKPLFYAATPARITFGSEVHAVLADPDVPRDVDLRAIDAFLVNQYVPDHLAAFRAVRKLPPASTLRWRPGGEPRIERYWRLEYGPKTPLAPAEAAEALREHVLRATRIRLMSEVPLGAFLSGGVDSSVVVAAMAQTSSGRVRTFSAAFPGADVDESAHARAVAERFDCEHHELPVGPPDPNILPRIAWHVGEPFADPAALPTYQLSELVRRHVTVALNGDGGDESFAGYKRYRQLRATRAAERVPPALRELAARGARAAAGGTGGPGAARRAARLAHRLALDPPHRYADLFRYLRDDERARLYAPELGREAARADPLAHVAAAWASRPGLDWTDRVMATDLETYLSDDLVAKVDRTSMAHSIEVRSPLLDTDLMSFAARLPADHKIRGGEGKVLLRDAARAWLPDELLDRPKQGFAVPLAGWLRGPMRELAESVLLDPGTLDRGLFVPREVERLLREHQDGRDHAEPLWALLNLELWYRTCVDSTSTSAADAVTIA